MFTVRGVNDRHDEMESVEPNHTLSHLTNTKR